MDEQKTTGTLYIVATPIGNSRDMSERGREILSTADIIAAEDTRRSVVLLNKLGIRGNSLSANHKFNEYGKAKWFIEQLRQGKSIAVITDAGTPCISDPGNELIRAAIDAGIRVVGVPGCCAAVTALSISGFDLSTFFFFGFLGAFGSWDSGDSWGSAGAGSAAGSAAGSSRWEGCQPLVSVASGAGCSAGSSAGAVSGSCCTGLFFFLGFFCFCFLGLREARISRPTSAAASEASKYCMAAAVSTGSASGSGSFCGDCRLLFSSVMGHPPSLRINTA